MLTLKSQNFLDQPKKRISLLLDRNLGSDSELQLMRQEAMETDDLTEKKRLLNKISKRLSRERLKKQRGFADIRSFKKPNGDSK
jgi:hypothetical protein